MENAVQKLCDWKDGENVSGIDQFEALILEVKTEVSFIELEQEDCNDNDHANLHAFLLKVFAEFRILRERNTEAGDANRAQCLLIVIDKTIK